MIGIDWAAFHFLRPLWLLALLPLVALLLLGVRRPVVSPEWARVCDPHLLAEMLGRNGAEQAAKPPPRWPRLLACVAGVIAVLAAAGPAWEQLPQPVFQAGEARVLVMDLSKSMDAADVPPSRLTRAKYAAIDLIDQLPEGDIGLVVFAGSAFTVLPLTDDRETMRYMIRSLETDLMPVQGGRIGNGLDDAVKLLEQSNAPQGDVILFTDSAPGDGTQASTAWMREKGHRLSIVGFGTREGAPIPQQNGGWVKDSSGAIVLARLEPGPLRALAAAGGGRYQTLPSAGLSARDFAFVSGRSDERADDDFKTDAWQDEGQRLVWLLLPLAALAFRRGWLMQLCLVAMLLPLASPPALAQQSLWKNDDQQAYEVLKSGDAAAAAERFDDQQWRGVAHYQAGNYEAAAAAFSGQETADAHYNRGNALARSGKLEEAVQAYDRALEADPNNEDARFNRDLVRQLRDQQQGEQGNEGDQSDSGDSDQSDSGQQPDGQDGQSGQSGQSGEGDQSDQPGEQGQQGQDSGQEPGQEQGQQGETQDGEGQPDGQSESEQAGEGSDTEQPGQPGDALSEEERIAEEKAQAIEQWLRRVPDDPGGLLRRKFQRDQQRRNQPEQSEQPW